MRHHSGSVQHAASSGPSIAPDYSLGNLWRRLALPPPAATCSLISVQQRLLKTGGRLLKHAPYYWPLLAESHLTRRLFSAMLEKIARVAVTGGNKASAEWSNFR